jgi:Transglutaminase-like superfamily
MSIPVASHIRRFFELPRHDRLLLLEAMLSLVVARAAIAWLPFRHVGLLAGRPIRQSELAEQRRLSEVKRVRWAIVVSASRFPWRAMCFQQGLAAQFMLRRRGVPSVLCYGAAPDDRTGLSAHVWVRDGGVDVIGGEIASHFALLATFPPQDGRS